MKNELVFSYTAHVELEGDGANGQVDESFVRVSGSFGQIEFGFRDHAMVRMHSGIKDVGIGLTSGDTQAWIPGAYLETAGHAGTAGGGNDPKLNYISPRAAGLQVGLSYAPGDGATRTTTPAGNDAATWGAGANFKQSIGDDMNVTFSVGHRSVGSGEKDEFMTYTTDQGITVGHRDAVNSVLEAYNGQPLAAIAYPALPAFNLNPDEDADETDDFEAAVDAGVAGTATLTDLRNAARVATGRTNAADAGRTLVSKSLSGESYTNVGFGVSFGAFGVNLAYASHDAAETYSMENAVEVAIIDGHTWNHDGDDGTTALIQETAADNDPSNDLFYQRVVQDPSNDATIWGASISYSDGPMSVSIGHMVHEEDSGGERDATMLSASYTLAPGAAWKSSVFAVEDTTSHVADGMNEGTGFVTGIAISF